MAEVFAMSRFRPAAFRDGWNRIAAAGPHGTPLRLGTRSRHGRRAPRGRRFTLGGSGKSVARCHRTVLAYWKFESISLQQRVHKLSVPVRAGRRIAFTRAYRMHSSRFLLLGGVWRP